MREWVKALPLGLGLPIVIGAASIKPEDAASNIAAWIEWFGFHNLPHWLTSPNADRHLIAAACCAAAIYSFAVWGPFRPKPIHSRTVVETWGPWLLILGGPILGLTWIYLVQQPAPNGVAKLESSSAAANLQPSLALHAVPAGTYELQWAPPAGFVRIKTSGVAPVHFLLKNETPSVVASRLVIVWRSETSIESVKEIILRDSKLMPFNPKFGNRRIVLNPRPDGGNLLEGEYPWSEADGYTLPILATEEAILLPPSVQFPALFYYIATMPRDLGKTTPPYLFSVSIKWQHPLGGLEQKFHVKMTATNSNPDVDSRYVIAHLNFEVEKIN
jgi:hypothetical protein